MQTTIAQHDLGTCRICNLRMEAGEWVSVSKTQGTAHTGCLLLRSENTPAADTEIGPLFGDAEQATLEHAKRLLGVKHISFDGATTLGVDQPRLAGQLAKIYSLMKDGRFRTLEQIANAAGCLETSASSRLRDFRKAKFGGHTVISRQVEGVPLLFEYQLILREVKEADGQRQAA